MRYVSLALFFVNIPFKTDCKFTEFFCIADAFCKFFNESVKKALWMESLTIIAGVISSVMLCQFRGWKR